MGEGMVIVVVCMKAMELVNACHVSIKLEDDWWEAKRCFAEENECVARLFSA